MSEKSMKISMYPEQSKSISKLIRRMNKYEDKYMWKTKSFCHEVNVRRLKSMIEQNYQFMLESLVDKNETDPFVVISENELIVLLLDDEEFIDVLVDNTLTNRIIKACISKNMSVMLAHRIRECITAYSIFTLWSEVVDYE